MNYVLFGMLALMFIVYVVLNRMNHKKRRITDQDQEQRINELEDKLDKMNTD